MGLTEILFNLLHAGKGRDVRQSLHDGVKIATDTAQEAMDSVQAATDAANEVKEAQKALDTKFNDQIKNMTLESPSDAEIVAARTKADGTTYDTLAKRLEADDGKTEFAAVVADASKLPTTGQQVGWVYNIESASVYGGAGMNVAWNGTAWDPLGEIFTITAITNEELDEICV